MSAGGPRTDPTEPKDPMTDFTSLGLERRLLDRLAEGTFGPPTPIQAAAIPAVLAGRDVMGLAQTGTGKTLAFGLPLLQRLTATRDRARPGHVRGLVLAPTRELAKQIHEALLPFLAGTGLRTAVVVGGVSAGPQVAKLSRGVDLLVATPGRLLDHLETGAVSLADARSLVLDEADQMLDLGFIHALRRIVRLLPAQRQTLLFSATMPKLMAEIAASYLQDPVRVEVAPPGKTADKVTQLVHFVTQGDKARLLEEYLDGHRDDLALVFSRTKHGAEKLMKLLAGWGFAAASIHGNKSQGQRDRALTAFRNGQVRVLVATDVAARGLDIPDVRHVYNYDLPNVPDAYVHRIGRTARAGRDGRAVAFCNPEEMADLRAIEKLTGQRIEVAGGTPWSAPAPAAPAARAKPKNRHRPRRRAMARAA
jgi:ATP-dependent RNA helicase RhlE